MVCALVEAKQTPYTSDECPKGVDPASGVSSDLSVGHLAVAVQNAPCKLWKVDIPCRGLQGFDPQLLGQLEKWLT